MTPSSRSLSRRRFLGELSCAGIGATSLFSSLLNLRLTAGAATPSPGSYKAMVCLFLAGGNDSFNMLVPRQIDAYNEYAATRDIIALERSSLLPISSAGQDYSEFGLHPNLPNLSHLYLNGHAAFVSNVGTLIQPVTLQEFNQAKNLIPRGLFSHSDQIFHWQTIVPQLRGGRPSGWAGRVQEVMQHVNEQSQIAMNVSLSGLNVFQTASSAATFTVSSAGAPEIMAYRDPVEQMAVDSLLDQNYRNLYQQTFANRVQNGLEETEIFSSAIEGVQLSTLFPATPTGQNLRMIAQIIAARGPLQVNRQIFFVQRGGWDHHTKVLPSQRGLFEEIDGAIGAFYQALVEIGVENDVTLFSASDFARTLNSNGQGSDHAWGGNHFVVGGGVNGGQIYGQYPAIATGTELDTGRGRLLPTLSIDHYAGELASWFGVPGSDMDLVLPNIRNFYDPATTSRPIGFMS